MPDPGYYDLHLHVLPGLDDGARTIDASLEMLEGLRAVGYRHFVATPHCDDHRFTYAWDRVDAAYAELREAVERRGLDVDLRRGAEYTYGPRFHAHVTERRAVTLADSRYVLLELPEAFMPATMPTALFDVGAHGYYPVLAHPERCKPFHDDVPRLAELANGRALVQVSFRSLAGTFGRTIKRTAWRLVTDEVADLVATDCHSPRELKKVVQPVIKALEKRLDPDHLDRLMRRFPARMLAAPAG
jgi:protein-tyrosine phosphatase